MIAELKKNTEQKMQKSLDALKHDLAKVRTGRAHTGILDHVQVEYYGSWGRKPVAAIGMVGFAGTAVMFMVSGAPMWFASLASAVVGRSL